MKPKFYPDMPMSEYHADRSVYSKSMLTSLSDCPAMFKWLYIDGNDKPDSKSLRIGRAVHTLALEPELFEQSYHIFEGTLRSNAKKEEWAEAEKEGKTVIRDTELEQVESMAKALTQNKFAKALLDREGYVESSIFWQYDGLNYKCRPDFMGNDGLLCDVKITKNVKPSLFFKDAYNYGYDISVALTAEGYEALHGKSAEEYVFVCVDSNEPHLVECYNSFEAAPDTGMSLLELGRLRLQKIRVTLKQCLASNSWPQYNDGITPMSMPAWAVTHILKEGDNE